MHPSSNVFAPTVDGMRIFVRHPEFSRDSRCCTPIMGGELDCSCMYDLVNVAAPNCDAHAHCPTHHEDRMVPADSQPPSSLVMLPTFPVRNRK